MRVYSSGIFQCSTSRVDGVGIKQQNLYALFVRNDGLWFATLRVYLNCTQLDEHCLQSFTHLWTIFITADTAMSML